MAYKPISITEKLDWYRDLSRKELSGAEIAERMRVTPAYISHFKKYWCAVDSGVLTTQLIRVIRVHNNVKETSGAKDRFTFDKTIREQRGLDVVSTDKRRNRVSVRFTVKQQEAALKETFESAKRSGRIRAEVETIERCADEELLSLNWSTFMGHLK